MRPCGTVGERLLNPLSSVAVAAFSGSVENVVSGFLERVYYTDALGTQRPRCTADLGRVRGMLERVVACVGPCNRETTAEYISSRTGSKRRAYEAAWEKHVLAPTPPSEWARVRYFVKREATTWSKTQVPRIISPREPIYNILLGKYLRPIEHKIYSAMQMVAESEVPVIAKGLTQEQKADIIVHNLNKFGMCVGLDASRFDQSIGKELLSLEHQLYRMLYPGDRLLNLLLSLQLDNSGLALCRDGIVRAKVGAIRCSGDVNTSLGNCIISTVLALTFLRENGITGSVLVDGDDCLLFMPRTALHLLVDLPAWYLAWGLRMVVEPPAYEPEEVEFCQSRPVWRGDAWVLCRNPSKAFNTDGYIYHELSESRRSEHLRAVGLCGLSMAAGLPLFQPYYKSLVDAGKTGKFDMSLLGGVGYQYRIQVRAGHLARCTDISPCARISFWRAFGIHPSEQLAIEGQLQAIDPSRPVDRVIYPKDYAINWISDRTNFDKHTVSFNYYG